MHPDVETAAARLSVVRSRLAGARPGEAAVRELEDALGEGAAHALAADAWLLRTDRRLRELVTNGLGPTPDLSVAAGERERVAQGVVVLRRELAALRHEHARLRGRDERARST